MSIEILAQWGKDMLDCANALERTRGLTNPVEQKCFVICTGVILYEKGQTVWTRNGIINDVIDRIPLIVFSDIKNLRDMLSTVCDNPKRVVDEVFKECNNIYPYWDIFYKTYYDKIIQGW